MLPSLLARRFHVAVGELPGVINHLQHLFPVLGSLETMKGKLLELACSLQTPGLQCLWMAGLKRHPSPVLRQIRKAAQTDQGAIKSCGPLRRVGWEHRAGDTYLSGTLPLLSVDAVTEGTLGPCLSHPKVPAAASCSSLLPCPGGEARPSCKAVGTLHSLGSARLGAGEQLRREACRFEVGT